MGYTQIMFQKLFLCFRGAPSLEALVKYIFHNLQIKQYITILARLKG
jgi:hypothetical protein